VALVGYTRCDVAPMAQALFGPMPAYPRIQELRTHRKHQAHSICIPQQKPTSLIHCQSPFFPPGQATHVYTPRPCFFMARHSPLYTPPSSCLKSLGCAGPAEAASR
jgi:hypothetical protein